MDSEMEEKAIWFKSLSPSDRMRFLSKLRELDICITCGNDITERKCWTCYESRCDLDPI